MIDPDRIFEIRRAKDEPPVALHHRIGDGALKRMWWTLPDGRRGLGGMPSRDLPLFGTELLAELPSGSTVILTEGEPAALALRARGYFGVATVCGAAVTPCDASLGVLLGFDVVLWPDDDQPGSAHMARIAERLTRTGVGARQIDLQAATFRKRLGEGADAADFDGTDAELGAAIDAAAFIQPSFDPEASARETGHAHEIPKGAPHHGAKPSQATTLVDLAQTEAEMFRSPDREGFLTYSLGERMETTLVRSLATRRWLEHLYFQKHGTTPSAQSVQDALGVLEGRAIHAGPCHPVHLRIARTPGRLVLDLGRDDGQAVEVDAGGWRILDRPSERFRRPRTMAALPVPVRGGSLALLDRYVNVQRQHRPLAYAFVVAVFSGGPYPVLVISGEHGSAKTTSARVFCALVDPSTSPVRAEPRDTRDLAIAATNAALVAFDNVSRLPDWLSDAVCRLATGGGFATRRLYTDDEEVVFNATRPVIITSIEDVAARGDILDRALLVRQPPIPDEERRREADFWEAFGRDRPAILGAVLDAVAMALARIDTIRVDRLPRMADFGAWSVAAEPAFPNVIDDDGRAITFVDTYAGNRADASRLALDTSVIVTPLLTILEDGPFEGSATELMSRLARIVGDGATRGRSWPRSARGLSGELRRLAPSLRGIGVSLVELRRTKRTRRIRLSLTEPPDDGPKTPSPPSPPSPEAETLGNPVLADDGGDATVVLVTEAVARPSPESGPLSGPNDGGDGVDGRSRAFSGDHAQLPLAPTDGDAAIVEIEI